MRQLFSSEESCVLIHPACSLDNKACIVTGSQLCTYFLWEIVLGSTARQKGSKMTFRYWELLLLRTFLKASSNHPGWQSGGEGASAYMFSFFCDQQAFMSVRQPGQRSFCKHDYSHSLQTRVRLGLRFHLLVTREDGMGRAIPRCSVYWLASCNKSIIPTAALCSLFCSLADFLWMNGYIRQTVGPVIEERVQERKLLKNMWMGLDEAEKGWKCQYIIIMNCFTALFPWF